MKLQYADSLSSTNWIDIRTNTVVQPLSETVLPIENVPLRFFRLLGE